MHRPRTALLLAVAVAAACLSSPPAQGAGVSGIDGRTGSGPGLGHRGWSPYGDSDQYTTKTTPPPSQTNIVAPVQPQVSPPAVGGGGGGSRNVSCNGSHAGVRPGVPFSQLLRNYLRAFLGITEQ